MQDRLSNESQPQSNVTQLCDCHGLRNCSSLISVHSECQERIETLQKERAELRTIVQNTKGTFEQLEEENRKLKLQLNNEQKESADQIVLVKQNLKHSETNIRELQRENERLINGKETLESYLKQLPSIDELEIAKAEAKEKSESCRRMQEQIENLNKKLLQTCKTREKEIHSQKRSEKDIEKLKFKVEELEAENIAHQKRLQRSSTSNNVDTEVLLHEREKFMKENDTLKNYILSTISLGNFLLNFLIDEKL